MLKTIGYYLFALVYYICRPFPVKKKRVLCIMTHDDGEGSNVSITVKALKKLKQGYSFSYITKKDTLDVKGFSNPKTLLSFFLIKPYQLARAQIILMDNTFLPLAYLRIKKGVKVVQLWHGTGTIKKFGQDFNTGRLKVLEGRANKNITHLIVNSPEMKKLYSKVFGVTEDKVYPIGLPKTDALLKCFLQSSSDGRNPDRETIYNKYKIPKEKKLVLYAPTFRDEELDDPRVLNKLDDIIKNLSKDYYLGLRLHPFIAKACKNAELPPQVCDLSFESDLTALLMASDILITDYSSIAFEYCITGRPMIFYAYDLKEFSEDGRGFYYNYESYVPGPVVYTGAEAAKVINGSLYDLNKVREFKENNFPYLDGKATERLIELLR